MARFGVSPTRGKMTKDQPARVTVAVLTFIPELEGYYRYRMEVLRACLESILKHTDIPYDLMVLITAVVRKLWTIYAPCTRPGKSIT